MTGFVLQSCGSVGWRWAGGRTEAGSLLDVLVTPEADDVSVDEEQEINMHCPLPCPGAWNVVWH